MNNMVSPFVRKPFCETEIWNLQCWRKSETWYHSTKHRHFQCMKSQYLSFVIFGEQYVRSSDVTVYNPPMAVMMEIFQSFWYTNSNLKPCFPIQTLFWIWSEEQFLVTLGDESMFTGLNKRNWNYEGNWDSTEKRGSKAAKRGKLKD